MVNSKKAKAMADQITTVSKNRLKNKISLLTVSEMELIERAIGIQLDLKKL
jgi:mRNA-degrading endonuclease toxin of MazEF toxin-antitoxin module